MHGADAARPGAGPARPAGGRQPARAAWDLAVKVDELQRMGPAAAARAEEAWLHGDHAAVAISLRRSTRRPSGSVTCRMRRSSATGWPRPGPACRPPATTPTRCRRPAGGGRPPPPGRRLVPVRARRRAGGKPGPEHLLTALDMLDELGARPLAAQVRARLRALGVTRIPRGPPEETRANPAGLTPRQIDVLRLLGKGYTNARSPASSWSRSAPWTVTSRPCSASWARRPARRRRPRRRAWCARRRGSVAAALISVAAADPVPGPAGAPGVLGKHGQRSGGQDGNRPGQADGLPAQVRGRPRRHDGGGNVLVGDRLGLYRALAEGPMQPGAR